MHLLSHDEGSARVFGLEGRLVASELPNAGPIVDAFSSDIVGEVVIDMSDLEFMDSSGVGMLIQLHHSATNAGKVLALRGAMGNVKKLIDTFQLSTMFELR